MARRSDTPPTAARDRVGALRAAARLARADLFARPGQTILTAVAIFAAATALVVTLALRAGLEDPFEDAMTATRGAHMAVHAGLTDADVARLRSLPGVVASDVRARANRQATVAGRTVEVGLEALPAADAAVDRPRLTDGRRPSAAGELLVERSFAREAGLRPGDRVAGGTITGLAVTTQQATYPRWDPGLIWATDVAGPERRVAVRLADPEGTEAFAAAARRALPGTRLAFTDWHHVRDTITDQTRTNALVISINTLLALFAVGFTVATVIGGRVLAQRREIGLLKAVGWTPRGIVALLVGEYLAVGFVAALLGLVAGAAIAPLLLEPMSSLLATPTPSALAPLPLLLALVLILAAVAVFTAVPALRAGRVKTIDALALGRGAGTGRASRAARIAAALRLPAIARLGVKDAFTSRSRASLTIAALTFMVVTLVAALSVEATFHRVIDDPALRAKPWDVRLEEPSALAATQGDPAVADATTISGFQVAGPRGELHARAVGDGFAAFPYAVPDGRMFARPGEAIAGRGLYETLGLQVGDQVTVRVEGQPVTLRLVGRHVEPDDDGEVVIFPAATLPEVPEPSAVIANFAPDTDQAAAARRLEAAAGVDAELPEEEVRGERADIRPIVLGSSLLLVAVGLVNLLATLLLVTRERARDFAIFKAVGLTPRGVLGVVNAGGAALGLIALAIGIPLGLVTYRAIMAAMSPSEGTDIVGTPGPFALLLTVPFVLAVTALASSWPGRAAVRVPAAAVLRAE
ncbi:FtsX-like permease family protein [Solirubrobacter sp. CPCC 204708]|uniref:FtsX-like permease family protein n=1 Tax=Solirubrobacter deserti TaxID=2282478 RepID=A0ABT4RI82_9ACTN|nr:ABC transporter permease [Solirubrobacter deserti]MBE2318869.1 FtsX-like permease family protein [Solirubrobacter deserti]MDA0138249.1 FtsX-like permease family protein [Solirubrobacter deserti]